MDYAALSTSNERAIAAVRDGSLAEADAEACANTYPFRGFVDCVAAEGSDGFVMFSNADDIVAAHYFYHGPASFEHGTLKLWCQLARNSRWIYDVGAFTGVFALAAVASNPDCRVIAFEPSFVSYSRLLVNIQANGFGGHIGPVQAGLGAAVGELSLRHSAGVYVMGSNETFVPDKIADPWFVEQVPIYSLDHLLAHQHDLRSKLIIPTNFEGADLIKIDVEGFEPEVLAGMRETIDRSRPTIILEVLDDDDKFADIQQITAKLDRLIDLAGAGYIALHIDESSGALSEEIGGRNHLLIHESKQSLLS